MSAAAACAMLALQAGMLIGAGIVSGSWELVGCGIVISIGCVGIFRVNKLNEDRP